MKKALGLFLSAAFLVACISYFMFGLGYKVTDSETSYYSDKIQNSRSAFPGK
ncbi:hypothetical protein [Bacillus altitudinis]|uniref:hypothetical protein n=1 Tax=Bacillus altitudinis TaxID=293387 RepID=UPI00227D9D3D|nr:hypothetical protein [Bacillus altitudinis]MCY7454245.1 hypothetical protein [Bacillus altitudinis]